MITKIKINNFKYLFIKNELDNIIINIDQKNLYNLELQRQQRLGNSKRQTFIIFPTDEIIYQGETFRSNLELKVIE